MTETKGIHSTVFWVILVLFVLSQLKKYVNDFKRGRQIRRIQNKEAKAFDAFDRSIENDQKALIDMMPDLKREFIQKRNELVSLYGELLSEEEKASLYAELPAHFWWEIPLERFGELDITYKPAYRKTGDVVWETRWVERQRGKEFQGAYAEFSPISRVCKTLEQEKAKYENRKHLVYSNGGGGYILDIITRGSSSHMEAHTRTFKYTEYKHSDFERFSKDMEVFSLAGKIDRAANEGKISQEDYYDLTRQFSRAVSEVEEEMNKTVERIGTETYYTQIKSHTNIWTGQLLLMDDPNAAEGYAIVDYRCQIPFMEINLDCLNDINITRVLGDPKNRDPYIMAKIHKMCPDCR